MMGIDGKDGEDVIWHTYRSCKHGCMRPTYWQWLQVLDSVLLLLLLPLFLLLQHQQQHLLSQLPPPSAWLPSYSPFSHRSFSSSHLSQYMLEPKRTPQANLLQHVEAQPAKLLEHREHGGQGRRQSQRMYHD